MFSEEEEEEVKPFIKTIDEAGREPADLQMSVSNQGQQD